MEVLGWILCAWQLQGGVPKEVEAGGEIIGGEGCGEVESGTLLLSGGGGGCECVGRGDIVDGAMEDGEVGGGDVCVFFGESEGCLDIAEVVDEAKLVGL